MRLTWLGAFEEEYKHWGALNVSHDGWMRTNTRAVLQLNRNMYEARVWNTRWGDVIQNTRIVRVFLVNAPYDLYRGRAAPAFTTLECGTEVNKDTRAC